MDDSTLFLLCLHIACAVYYGYVALKILKNKEHHRLCRESDYDPKFIALFWLPFLVLALVLTVIENFKK